MTAIATKEWPIIFSGEMVRAILDGRKTQTRRVVKQQKDWWRWMEPDVGGGWCAGESPMDDKLRQAFRKAGGKGFDCPHGVPGDRLWVRETYRLLRGYDGLTPTLAGIAMGEDKDYSVDYRATPMTRDTGNGPFAFNPDDWGKWRPSIHMPRWACRIVPELTDVRVQRIQEITEWEARDEGCEPVPTRVQDLAAIVYGGPRWVDAMSYLQGFAKLWDSLNAKRGYPLESNPWVWAITFRKLSDEELQHV